MVGLGPNTCCREGREQYNKFLMFREECGRRGLDFNGLFTRIDGRDKEAIKIYNEIKSFVDENYTPEPFLEDREFTTDELIPLIDGMSWKDSGILDLRHLNYERIYSGELENTDINLGGKLPKKLEIVVSIEHRWAAEPGEDQNREYLDRGTYEVSLKLPFSIDLVKIATSSYTPFDTKALYSAVQTSKKS